jgi:hypothetical protein
MSVDKETLTKRLRAFVSTLVIVLVWERIFLYFFPNVNLDIGKYGVHHLYTGALLLILVIILMIFDFFSIWVMILAGISAALVLDEWIFLVVQGGGDNLYFSKVSFLGAILLSLLVIILILFLFDIKKTRVITRETLPGHFRVVASLIVIQFILDIAYSVFYQQTNLIKATMIGLSALIVLFIPAFSRLTDMKPYIAFLPIYFSSFFGTLLMQTKVVAENSLASGLAHMSILGTAYFFIISLRKSKSTFL